MKTGTHNLGSNAFSDFTIVKIEPLFCLDSVVSKTILVLRLGTLHHFLEVLYLLLLAIANLFNPFEILQAIRIL